jgi:hypothetical protein
VTAIWIVIGLAVAAAMIVLVTARRRQSHHADLGVVSSQWMAEQRMTQDPNQRR